MKIRHEDEGQPRTEPAPSPTLTIRTAANASDAEQLLPLSVLRRLCSDQLLSPVRQVNVYRSQVIVALDSEVPVGFAAYKPTTGPVRVAHEFWVDPEARCGLAAVTEALLERLESIARKAECSRLFIVLAQSTPLRQVLANAGYGVSLAGGELMWSEKGIADEGHPSTPTSREGR